MDRWRSEAREAEPTPLEREERLSQLLNTLIEGVAYCEMVFDADGRPVDWRYLEVNPAFARITGLEDITGKLASEAIPGLYDANPELYDIYGDVVRTGTHAEFDSFVSPLPRGQWLHVVATRPSQGRFVAVFTDITERKEAELALRASEERFRMLVEQTPDGILLSDSEGRFVEANAAAADMLGYPREGLLGLSLADVLADEELPHLAPFIERVDRGEVARHEWRFKRKDGSRFIGELLERRLPDGQLQGVFRDTTDRRAAEDAIRDLNVSLEQRVELRTAEVSAANQELEAFAYAVSHDLRAPLRAMNGFSQALKEDFGERLGDEAESYLDHIQAATRNMEGLIDGLLTLSRATQREMVRGRVDVSSLAKSILEELATEAPERHVTWDVGPDITAEGDPRMIEVVLRNLLGNAWKYTGKTAEARIDVTTLLQEGARWICVTDNGAGFDPAYMSRLFQPFQRLHRQDEFPGLGIGLATVKRIVDRHGGRILAVATPEQGARFCFTLPEGALAESADPTA